MATKVMLAPALARRDPAAATGAGTAPAADPKPKRRRSSVYDADGNEVFITLLCLKCRRMRPLAQFGLRRMADGAIRNQPWCRACRSAESPSRRARQDDAIADASVPVEATAADGSQATLDPSKLAAQVLAALQGGRR